ncbi:hypothetical protein N7510_000236 [Penicillium lagena]|uniref:uncharacterized protein n=1 Tax=Penicillium lagena TaxID=94218 RepID=UPI002542187E|nr:uncharacterized protein N7510_000236 [Penicillium lagena]KAJ5623927.1 hypothetical protein N7510_000236 [Penicillium lagena]
MSIDPLLTSHASVLSVRTHIFAAFAAVAWYNAIELIIICFATFKRWRGTYFWSLLVASASIVPLVLGYVLLFFPTGVPATVCVALIVIGWCGMVTGQSVVLWSRLHIVEQNSKVLRAVLFMIIINAILLHVPIIVLMFGAVSAKSAQFLRGYRIMEHIQLIGFCIQELIISTIYVWDTAKLLRLRPRARLNSILHQLLIINIVIVILDVAIVAIEYRGYYAIQVMFKPVAYSIKLKLEYAILGKLVSITRCRQNILSCASEITPTPPSQELPLQPCERQSTCNGKYSLPWRRADSQHSQTSILDT